MFLFSSMISQIETNKIAWSKGYNSQKNNSIGGKGGGGGLLTLINYLIYSVKVKLKGYSSF